MNKKLINATELQRYIGVSSRTLTDWNTGKSGEDKQKLMDFLRSIPLELLKEWSESRGEQVETFKDKRFKDNN